MATSQPICISDFEKLAREILPRNALDYYRSGACQEQTLYDNQEAFKRLRILPRILQDVSQRNMQTTVLGKPIWMPIGVAPTAMQRMAHSDGECGNARAAAAMGTIFVLSTLATSSIEEVAKASPQGRKWFQLYIFKDRKASQDLITRAEKVGFEAIVLTVDAPYFGLRLADLRNKFALPPHLRMANFPKGTQLSEAVSQTQDGSGINEYIKSCMDQSLTWKDILWLRSLTNLPVILKGVLTPEDAVIAVNSGINGIIVSNHGARQLDGVPASIEALPEIIKAVNGKCEVYMDGGITHGTDVFKAIALGAKMVFLGRPMLWGLAYNGEKGAQKVLEILKNEFDVTMALAGT